MFDDPKSHARLEVSASSSDSSVLLTERGTSVLKVIKTSESVHTFCSQRSTESTGRVCRRGLTPLAERLGRMAGVMPGTQFSGAVCCRSAFQTIQTFSHNKCSRCRIEFWTHSQQDKLRQSPGVFQHISTHLAEKAFNRCTGQRDCQDFLMMGKCPVC